jgi:hypothetical protein
MSERTYLISLLLLSLVSLNVLTQVNQSQKVPTVPFCDLLRHPELHGGKEVRFQAIYRSVFEGSSFYDPACNGDARLTNWADFDRSVKASMTPEELKRFGEIFCCHADEPVYTLYETRLTVTGILLEGKDRGYGRGTNSSNHFLITVKRVEEIGTTTRTGVAKERSNNAPQPPR